ncbi:MAG: NmrA family NAD(P)-binding protein [Candidatus Lokiarchaeota archaeon]|nr:NmrA family NAD(P)-binding protein [Candidatus Lokiarchaeota archaeon]
MEKFLVTGATGRVGSVVFQQLKNHAPEGSEIIAGDIDESLVKKMHGNDALFRELNYEKPQTIKSAIKGITKVFLMRPPQIEKIKKYMAPFIIEMKDAGVKHVVFLSIIDANPMVPHFHVEKFIKRYNIPYTMLRCSFFMQNLDMVHGDIIKKELDICIPAGTGKTSFIDARDIGEAVAICLTNSEKYIGATIPLTGSESLDYNEVSEKMTEILGLPIKYSNPDPKDFVEKMTNEYGFPKDYVQVMKMICWVVRSGKAGKIYPDLEKILGRKPRLMDDYIKDYQNSWR